MGRANWLTAYASALCAQGLGPRLVRTFGQKLNYFYAYAMLQNLHKLLSGGQPLGVLMNLVIGFLGDVCCIFLVVPLELMSMRQSEGEGLLTMFRKIYSTSGIAGFYQVGGRAPGTAAARTGTCCWQRLRASWLCATVAPHASVLLTAAAAARCKRRAGQPTCSVA
eukprot:COSAG01_NODE_9545_length_2414_cov_1.742117_3_plen_166_part_00